MELTVSQQIFAEFLQDLSRVVAPRSPQPVLRFALLSAREDHLIGRATNLEVYLEEQIPAQVHEEGLATLPAREAAALVASLDPALLRVRAGEEGILTLEHPVGHYQFAGVDPAEFPDFQPPPEEDGVVVELAPFLEGVKRVEYCRAPRTHEPPFLAGILLEVRPGELRLVATDGHRLAFYRRNVEGVSTSFDAIVYPEALQFLRTRTDLAVRIQVKGRMCWFRFDNGWVASRTLEGPYAPYEQVIPREEGMVLEGSTEEMVALLRRMEFFAAPPLHRVIFRFSPEGVEVEAASSDQGQAVERFSGTYAGEEMTVAFNHRHLLDAMRNLPTERFRLTLYEPQRPVKIEPVGLEEDEELLYLVMPIALE